MYLFFCEIKLFKNYLRLQQKMNIVQGSSHVLKIHSNFFPQYRYLDTICPKQKILFGFKKPEDS